MSLEKFPHFVHSKQQIINEFPEFIDKICQLWKTEFIPGKKGYPKKIKEEIESFFKPFAKSFSHLTIEQISQILINLLTLNSPEYAQHCQRTANLAYQLALNSGMFDSEDLTDIYYTGLLHDIGKMIIPRKILESKNGLSIEEKDILRLHTIMSFLILNIFPQTKRVAKLILFHHEREDGNGQFKVEKTNIDPKIWFIIIADYFDAMSSQRPYKKPLTAEKSLEEIIKDNGAVPKSTLNHMEFFLKKRNLI
ncbi:MAG: HD domain-containing protein [Patescibacteria group bacterium]|nr:HD domain-containing protein [Patescibacteria group bacterium]